MNEGYVNSDEEETEEYFEDTIKFIESLTWLLLERAIPEKKKALTLRNAGNCLGILGKIWNLSEYPPPNYFENENTVCDEEKLMDMEGYVDEYQYLHMEAVDMNLTHIAIIPQYFIWLLSVDLSGNLLTNERACPVTKLPNLVALKLNRNRFRDPYMPVMKHLQYLGLNSNKIESLHRIYHPNLETLDMNYNRLRRVRAEDCWKLSKLTSLELRGNLLKTTRGIQYTTLVSLYLAENQIKDLRGLEALVNLRRLHLRDNPLSILSGFSDANSKLQYLNIRKCQIDEAEEIKKLSILDGLRELIIKGNNFNPEPEKQRKNNDIDDIDYDIDDNDEDEENMVEEEPAEEEGEEDDSNLRIQILTYLPKLIRIDKKQVTEMELNTAKELTSSL